MKSQTPVRLVNKVSRTQLAPKCTPCFADQHSAISTQHSKPVTLCVAPRPLQEQDPKTLQQSPSGVSTKHLQAFDRVGSCDNNPTAAHTRPTRKGANHLCELGSNPCIHQHLTAPGKVCNLNRQQQGFPPPMPLPTGLPNNKHSSVRASPICATNMRPKERRKGESIRLWPPRAEPSTLLLLHPLAVLPFFIHHMAHLLVAFTLLQGAAPSTLCHPLTRSRREPVGFRVLGHPKPSILGQSVTANDTHSKSIRERETALPLQHSGWLSPW